MEILTAYVRYHASWSFVTEEKKSQSYQLAPDIQAILTVVGRRTRTYGKGENHYLDLSGTDLRNAVLIDAHLEEADIGQAHLNGAILWRARLKGTSFYKADLKRAYLRGAHLEMANLEAADLDGADLREAYLVGARNLTVEQLATVKTLYDAHIDPPLLEQIRQQYPKLLEKPQD
jgi:Pentapeptide repeats (8 copies)